MDYLFFAITLLGLLILISYLALKYHMLNDESTAKKRPYSYARTQLAWWTFIVIACIVTLFWITGNIPALDTSSLALLGMGALTTGFARVIDVSDTNAAKSADAPVALAAPADPAAPAVAVAAVAVAAAPLSRDKESQGFFLDILSDNNGISIARLQSLLFNLTFGLYYLYQFGVAIATLQRHASVDKILPVFSTQQLALIGVSSFAYLGLKASENK
ncbi:MAG TPA: hypothetical protein VNU72_10535 [Puia sp.]|jgi:hypothetical protein|nr:hypothetical protein [Puia sp.]